VAKKEFACNGTVVDHSEYGEVLQLQVRLLLTI
jgi:translation initiation factor 1